MDEPRYIIIHGHFYQPPRQSPWTGLIANEASAAPFVNWNERILSECYLANAHAHIMEGRVVHIRNNYESLSFDVGPTLAGWLETHGKTAYRAMRRGDELSGEARRRGNAIAQAYNHSILPIRSARDRILQIEWGLADFIYRFGRRPEGMWLPECAADDATLAAVAEAGVRFVILGADQGRFSNGARDAGPFIWRRENLNLAVFRFDRELSGWIAFSDALRDGAALAGAIADTALTLAPGAALLIATDGETFGHHKKTGAAELARAFALLAERDDLIVTNCAAYLAGHPAAGTFRIDGPSSWSCPHGVERWRNDCGCRLEAGSNQEWRGPLLAAMEFVKDHSDAIYDRFAPPIVTDHLAALRDSARVMIDPGPEPREELFARYKVADEGARERLLRLFEMALAAQATLTSCAWFFDDFGGPEGRVVLRWAARAVELAEEFAATIEPQLLGRLREVKSSRREVGNAATLYLSLKTREARGRL
jgi:hypothetical protein